uniref:Uncharacterized protein n=1 Tax=Aegilops tauschii subsp. strangulata TaxID=200361 RepID=A0A453D5X9_AEGTS
QGVPEEQQLAPTIEIPRPPSPLPPKSPEFDPFLRRFASPPLSARVGEWSRPPAGMGYLSTVIGHPTDGSPVSGGGLRLGATPGISFASAFSPLSVLDLLDWSSGSPIRRQFDSGRTRARP